MHCGFSVKISSDDPLKGGWCTAPESKPISVIPDALVDPTIPYLTQVLAVMVRSLKQPIAQEAASRLWIDVPLHCYVAEQRTLREEATESSPW